MSFSITYLRHGKAIWESTWPVDLPPACHFVQYSLLVHEADTAIILDEDGKHLTIERRQKTEVRCLGQKIRRRWSGLPTPQVPVRANYITRAIGPNRLSLYPDKLYIFDHTRFGSVVG